MSNSNTPIANLEKIVQRAIYGDVHSLELTFIDSAGNQLYSIEFPTALVCANEKCSNVIENLRNGKIVKARVLMAMSRIVDIENIQILDKIEGEKVFIVSSSGRGLFLTDIVSQERILLSPRTANATRMVLEMYKQRANPMIVKAILGFVSTSVQGYKSVTGIAWRIPSEAEIIEIMKMVSEETPSEGATQNEQ